MSSACFPWDHSSIRVPVNVDYSEYIVVNHIIDYLSHALHPGIVDLVGCLVRDVNRP